MPCAIAQDVKSGTKATPVPIARFPEESLLLGSARAYTRNGLEYYQRCERTAGIVKTRFLWKQGYVITEPSAIADVLLHHPDSFMKPYVLQRLRVLFGEGLLTADGEKWKEHRRLIQPAFSTERIAHFLEVVRGNAEAMVSSWRNGEVRDIYADVVELCLKNVAQTMFGAYDEELGGIGRALAATCHQLVQAVFDVIRPRPLRFPFRLQRQVQRELGALNSYLQRLIERREGQPARRDFLGLLLAAAGPDGPLDRQAILDESVTMLLAGHETTTSAVIWALYLLARHPQQADKLARDLQAELHGEAPSYRELNRLDSLRATLDETLRLYPATHRIARTVIKPVKVGGHVLPVGSDVVMPQWAVHRSSRWFRDPEAFVPSRWSPSFRRSLPRFAYFPFSGGARTCVGAQLAWCESAAIVALLTQRFRLTLADNDPLVPAEGLTLLPSPARLRVRLERRSRTSSNVAFAGWTQPAQTEMW